MVSCICVNRCLNDWTWSTVNTQGTPPAAVYSHSCTPLNFGGKNSGKKQNKNVENNNEIMLFIGGVAQDVCSNLASMTCLHLPTYTWFKPEVSPIPHQLTTINSSINSPIPQSHQVNNLEKKEKGTDLEFKKDLTLALFTRHKAVMVTLLITLE